LAKYDKINRSHQPDKRTLQAANELQVAPDEGQLYHWSKGESAAVEIKREWKYFQHFLVN